jgi:hypothetical protein
MVMRFETKLIKDILRAEYPDARFHVRFCAAAQYVDGSDKITIKSPISYNDLRTTMQHYTRGICIFPKGMIASRGGECKPEVLNPQTKEWVDFDLCEFIEVDSEVNHGR